MLIIISAQILVLIDNTRPKTVNKPYFVYPDPLIVFFFVFFFLSSRCV